MTDPRASNTPASVTSKGPPLPPLLFLACLAAGGLLEFYIPLPFRPAGTPLKVIAFLLLMAAAVLILSTITIMHRRKTPLHPTDTPRALVTTGPFRLTRNPIYLGLLLILAASSLVYDSFWLVLAVPVLLLLLNKYVVPREEQALTVVFGEEYIVYRRRVRRWL